MTISDQTRYRLHQRLEEVLGPDDAATLMEHLPPVGWADVATNRDLDHLGVLLRSDLDHLGVALRGEIDQLGLQLHGEILQLHGEIDQLRGEMNVGFAEVRTELHQGIGGIRADMARQIPTLFVGMLGLQVSAAALFVAASRLA